MKKLLIAFALFFSAACLNAQNKETEATIRSLEQLEVQAILNKDSVTLLKLWAKDYTVNSPDNVVVIPGQTTLDRPVLKRARTSFAREIEHVIIKEGFAIVMGNETVVPVDDPLKEGQVVKRRFTNIWQQQDGVWKLIARHANIICKKD
ncbi:hypothetical protein CAP36_12925 [Chitinophagaceae bacterium IBVUCB2]|nr:hypothetical protein CAP36_12925 [Chitinophagaceae bacterium IBVUCB2]